MRFLVTGGAGFIGSHLVDRLLNEPSNSVTVFDNLSRGRLQNLATWQDDTRLTLVLDDLLRYDQLLDAMAGADVVFHLAAQSNVLGAVTDPRVSFESNVVGTFNVLSAARELRVKRMVFASSREAYGEVETLPVHEDVPLRAKNPYGASKVAGEAYCQVFRKTFGVDTCILRFSNVYGTRDFGRVIPHWLERASRGETLEIYGGDQVIDFVPVQTVVKALCRAIEIETDGLPINVASGVGTPIRALAVRIGETIGTTARVRVIEERSAEVRRFVADVGRMKRLLSIHPDVDSLQYLPSLVHNSTYGKCADVVTNSAHH